MPSAQREDVGTEIVTQVGCRWRNGVAKDDVLRHRRRASARGALKVGEGSMARDRRGKSKTPIFLSKNRRRRQPVRVAYGLQPFRSVSLQA